MRHMEQVYATRHAIERYQERVRMCSWKHTIEQLRAIYATGVCTNRLPSGDEFYQAGDVRIVVDPLGRIMTVYTT